MSRDSFNTNNFDLLRLYAASQVALHHALRHLQVEHADWMILKVTRLFPGVPIFFFISGLLITRSYENSRDLSCYFHNRVLRIYPGLLVCLAASMASVAALGYFRTIPLDLPQVLTWLAAQSTFAQFYNPEFLRGYGVGALNGSLWTIPVELQFYLLVPFLCHLLDRTGQRRQNLALAVLLLLFFLANRVFMGLDRGEAQLLLTKLAGVSFLPWFGMFLMGVLFQKNYDRLHALLAGRALPLLLAYCGWALLLTHFFGLQGGNDIHPLLFLLLAPLLFALAFTRCDLAGRLLRRNDLSYGIYIYHMPVVNALLYLGVKGGTGSVALALAGSLACAALSWVLVEKPFLRRKKKALNPIDPPQLTRTKPCP
ncbi:MAG: acyltransferase [Proteobacteria bacterium]|nr:acyltransferase [Pseudomonadota bacterium]